MADLLPIDLSSVRATLLAISPKQKFSGGSAGSAGDAETVVDEETGLQVFSADLLLVSDPDADPDVEHLAQIIRVSVPLAPGRGPNELLELVVARPNTPVRIEGLRAGCFVSQGRAKFYYRASGLSLIETSEVGEVA